MPQPPSRPPDDGPEIAFEPLRYRPGDLVGEKVRLVELLGEGGMGTVWRAHHLSLDVDVAVKLLHGELISPESSEQLQREAHAAARLQHPSAVRVHDFGRTELGDSYIVMELLQGESLADVLARRHHLPPEETVALLLPVAGALAAAHARGIVHRDLKPENVVLVETAEGFLVPKVVDFGIAKVDRPGRASIGDGDALLGSPAYMAPEHVLGDGDVDARSDVFSLGVLIYEMLAGRTPFAGREPIDVLRAICEDEPAPLDQIGACDAELAAVVARALAKRRDARWPDMRAFGRELAAWALAHDLDTDATGASVAIHWGLAGRVSRAPSWPASFAAPTSGEALAFPGGTATRRTSSLAIVAAIVAVGLVIGFSIQYPSYRAAKAEREAIAARGVGTASPGARATALPGASAARAPGSEAQDAAGTPRATPSSASLVGAMPTGIPSSSATSGAAPVAPVSASPSACVASLFPPDSFHEDASLLGMCSERDPRRGGALLRGEVARHGLLAGRTTEAMRTWAVLSWYEMAAFVVIQHACCPAARLGPAELPPTVGTCEPLGPRLDALAAAVRADRGVDEAAFALRAVVGCIERGERASGGRPSPYRAYVGAPSSGADAALRKVLDAARARR